MSGEVNVRHWTIYMYTFPNNKKYIGATTRPLIHRQGSVNSEWRNYKRCKLLYEAIQEFGIENIDQTILFEGMMEDRIASELESFFIEMYKTNVNMYSNPTYGYNQTNGGEGVNKKNISEKTKERLREQMKAFHAAKLGTHPTEETRRRLSISHMGQKRGVMSEETRKKISQTNRKNELRPSSNSTKALAKKHPVIVYCNETGEAVLYDSCMDVGYQFGVNSATVSRWLNGSRRPPSGYQFVKAEDYDPNCGWEVKSA